MSETNKYIRVFFTDINNSNLRTVFNAQRNDEYKTTIDSGYEDLDLKEDATKIKLYMDNDLFTFNNNKHYRVVSREFQPNIPVMLCIDVEEVK